MDYIDAISLSAFILGGISIIMGVFLSIMSSSIGLISTNAIFEAGFIFWVFFWVVAIGIRSYYKEKS